MRLSARTLKIHDRDIAAGRALFEACVVLARTLGARRMTIPADPNAAPFYERMGARFLRNAPSDAIPDRSLPLYDYDLAPGTQT